MTGDEREINWKEVARFYRNMSKQTQRYWQGELSRAVQVIADTGARANSLEADLFIARADLDAERERAAELRSVLADAIDAHTPDDVLVRAQALLAAASTDDREAADVLD